MNYLDKINAFDENNLLSLDEVVLWALELFENTKLPNIDISDFKRPLVFWSWNAITTAKIIFSRIDALFCDETNFLEYLERNIDWVVIMSASWEKHASISAEIAKSRWIKTKLITCNESSTAWDILWKENTFITPKNREPYTYNTSTYLWWVLAYTWEDSKEIKYFIKNTIDPILEKIDFSNYDSYLFVTPDKFSLVNQLFIVKFIELFGRKIARDVFSYEQIKHAITVVSHEKELAISFWEWEFFYKWNSLKIPLPDNCWLWTMIAIWYYLVGKIQNSYPQYFKESIWRYIEDLNKTSFWKNLKVVV